MRSADAHTARRGRSWAGRLKGASLATSRSIALLFRDVRFAMHTQKPNGFNLENDAGGLIPPRSPRFMAWYLAAGSTGRTAIQNHNQVLPDPADAAGAI